MAFLVLSLFCALFAEELIPVEAPGNKPLAENLNCGLITNANGGSAACFAQNQCFWDTAVNPAVCKQDTCYKYISGEDQVACSPSANCAIKTTPTNLRKDCSDGPNTHYCALGVNANNGITMTYCEYSWLKSGRTTCPSPACVVGDQTVGTGQGKFCLPASSVPTTDACSSLDDIACPMNPKCYWNTSATPAAQCWPDECYIASSSGSVDCASIPGGTCTDFKPYKDAGGAIYNFCVNKDKNKTPNKCYFLGEPYAINSANPTCDGGISSCDDNANCATYINKQGSYAGKYCDDGSHGGSSILHIPTVLVLLFLLISIFSF